MGRCTDEEKPALGLLLHVVPSHMATIGLEGGERGVVVFEVFERGIADRTDVVGDEVHIDMEMSQGKCKMP